jgi:hypothetical protein
MGGVISYFKFEGYKIDHIHYNIIPEVNFLLQNNSLTSNEWKINLGFKPPLFYKNLNKYIGGLNLVIIYPKPKRPMVTNETEIDNNLEITENVVELEIGITGIFSVEEGTLTDENIENLVKIQIPTLLFPYVRSAISSIFSNSGFVPMIFPLINVQELAKNAKLTITEIE